MGRKINKDSFFFFLDLIIEDSCGIVFDFDLISLKIVLFVKTNIRFNAMNLHEICITINIISSFGVIFIIS